MLKKRLEQAKAEEQWEDCGKYTRQIKQLERWLKKKEELEKSKALALKAEDYIEVGELAKQIKALASRIDKAATIESVVRTNSSATLSTAAKATPKSTSIESGSFPPDVPNPDVSLSIIGSKEDPILQSTSEGKMTTYVLENGSHYKVKIKNDGPVSIRGKLSIDGKIMGNWQYKPHTNYQPIERPTRVAKKFTFYTIRAVRAAESAVAASAAQSAKPASAGKKPLQKFGYTNIPVTTAVHVLI